MAEEENKHLWEQFVRLGERIGDGDHEPWMSREYKRLSKILVPEIKEAEAVKRKQKAQRINEQIQNLILNIKCKKEGCDGTLRQSRSGSKICYCNICNTRYKATTT